MNPLTFAGEGFSEYFCTQLIGTDPQLKSWLDADTAEASYKKASAVVRSAQRSLRDREQARSTVRLLLQPLAELLDWRLGERSRIATEEQEEEGGVPLLASDSDRVLARALYCPGRTSRRCPARPAPQVRTVALAAPRPPRVGPDLWRAPQRLRASTDLRHRHTPFIDRIRPDGDRRRNLPGLDTWKLLHALCAGSRSRANGARSSPRDRQAAPGRGKRHWPTGPAGSLPVMLYRLLKFLKVYQGNYAINLP